RRSSYFIPIPPPKKKSSQGSFAAEWNAERIQENIFINNVRARVTHWREGGYVGITSVTRELLDYWRDPDRERRLFFCQIEALETAIYLGEVVGRTSGDVWITNQLKQFNDLHNPGLPRQAIKMATGSGKTVVMGMLIAW